MRLVVNLLGGLLALVVVVGVVQLAFAFHPLLGVALGVYAVVQLSLGALGIAIRRAKNLGRL
jgi:hypothetical protein